MEGCQRELGLYQQVQEAAKDNVISDLILTNELNLDSDVSVGEPLGASDHSMVRCCININGKLEETDVEVPDFKRGDFQNLVKDTNSED